MSDASEQGIALRFEGHPVRVEPGATVLDALLQAGHDLAHGCRAGHCQSCRVRVVAGSVAASAQEGLSTVERARGTALACRIVPEGPLVLTRAEVDHEFAAQVLRAERLSASVVRLVLERPPHFSFRAGQHLGLIVSGVLAARRYSIATPTGSDELELHIRLVPGGQVSAFVAGLPPRGTLVRILEARGEAVFEPEPEPRPLTLIGAGTGLAPMVGVLRDAIAARHGAPVHLWAVGRLPERLYLESELRALAAAHPQLLVRFAVAEGRPHAAPADVLQGDLKALLDAHGSSASGRRHWVAGDPELVQMLKRHLFLAGAARCDIKADAFLASAAPPR